MKRTVLLYHMSVLVLCGILASCATPIPPTGGPPDKEGPKLEYTTPETGTTNFEGRTFEFQFDEFINRSSVGGEITIEPDLLIPYEIDWKRKRMILEFEEDLPDSTTIIVTLGPGVTDTRNNKIGDPITIAVSTGDEIDEGKIAGKILSAKDGKGLAERKVLLYRTPVDYTNRANYQAITDTSGSFEFSYLREGTYQALLVDDRNRNKIWDEAVERAWPFNQEFITLEENAADTLAVLYTVQTDTTRPDILGVGLLSSQRLRLRFSEAIKYKQEEITLAITDSSGNPYSSAYPLYIPKVDNFVLFARSEQSLQEEESYTLRMEGITDLSGNELLTRTYEFMGSSQEDTTQQRIISANEENGILQDEPFRVTYATNITRSVIRDSTVVIEGEVDFKDWPEIRIRRNELIINPQGEWIEGVDYQFLVWNPKTKRRKVYKPEVWDSTDYAEIEVQMNSADSLNTYIVELLNPAGERVRMTTFQQNISLSNLPPIPYTLMVYQDLNENGAWDSGSVIPFRAPEPYFIQNRLTMQRGFTSEVNITL